MKLLDKKVVNAEVATQRKQQIDQGISIAKKVDALQNTFQEESQRLESFRTESVRKVQEEIDAKIAEKIRLENILVPMREEYARLLVPPDLSEIREKLALDSENMAENRQNYYTDKNNLEQAIALNIQRTRMNEEEKQRIEVEKKRSEENLFATEQMKEDALKNLMESRSEAQQIINNANDQEKAVKIREQEVSDIEVSMSNWDKKLQSWESDLSGREKKLKVNQEVFSRAKNYLKNK